MAKLQIKRLKFRGIWILNFKILEFEFSPLKFRSI